VFLDIDSFQIIRNRWNTNTLAVDEVLNTKPGRQSGLYRVESSQRKLFVKQYSIRHSLEKIKYLFKSTRAMAEFRNNALLHDIGVSVPGVLALAEQKRKGLWQRSLLVLEVPQDTVTLKQYSETHACNEFHGPLIKKLANDIAHMHNNGVYYRDLHAGNILVAQNDAHTPRIYFVDLNEVKRQRALKVQHCLDDLARLNAFVTAGVRTRLRFLLYYLKTRNVSKQRQWLERIDRRTRTIWQRYESKHPHFERKY